MDFIRNWLSERTTWTGLFALLVAFNIHSFTEEQRLAITAVGISLVARNENRRVIGGR